MGERGKGKGMCSPSRSGKMGVWKGRICFWAGGLDGEGLVSGWTVTVYMHSSIM